MRWLRCAMGLALWWAAPSVAAAPAPDLILHNGKVLTVDSNFSIAQAVAITGNRISTVGSEEEVLATAGPATVKIDLKGRTVTPGLVDTHRHVYSAAEANYGGLFSNDQLHRHTVDWRGVKSKEDVLAQVKAILAKGNFKPGQWVYLTNQLTYMVDPPSPLDAAAVLFDQIDQWDLGKAAPDHPLLMTLGLQDFNGLLLNEKAMQWLMAHHGHFVKQNGRYWVDRQGRPDGHLEPPASRLVLPFTYDRDPQILAELYQRAMQESAAMGLTSVSTRLPQDSLAAYQLLERQGRMRLRIGYGVVEAFGRVDVGKAGLKEYARSINSGSPLLWITAVAPTAMDGSRSRQCTDQKRIGTYTPIDGWFPFGQCHSDGEYKGAANRAAPIYGNYFQDWVMASGRDGVRFANTHVAGDRAVAHMLNFAEQLQQQYGPQATQNWALDHCGMINPRDFARLAKLKLTVSCYVMASINEAAAMARAYGEEIANTFASPLNSLLKAGVKVVLESDSDSYLWEDLRAAITRKDRQGRVWGPQERVDRPTALRMFTAWAADYLLRGDQFGSIEKDRLADLLVLDKDYLTVPEDEIGAIQPQLTVFDGKIIFVHPSFAEEYNLRPEGALVATYQDLVKARVRRNVLVTGD